MAGCQVFLLKRVENLLAAAVAAKMFSVFFQKKTTSSQVLAQVFSWKNRLGGGLQGTINADAMGFPKASVAAKRGRRRVVESRPWWCVPRLRFRSPVHIGMGPHSLLILTIKFGP